MAREASDLVVIGGGPGGYVAALRASQLGGKVVLVERDIVGGTCLNRGCIPTKALLSSIEKLESCREAAACGVDVGPAIPNLRQMMDRKDQIVSNTLRGLHHLLGRANVSVIKGHGSVVEPGVVKVHSTVRAVEHIRTRAIIIATGSEPIELHELPYDGERIIDSTQALQLDEIPLSLLVVGGGAIGLEFATIFNALGSKVTVIEKLHQILPNGDEETASLLRQSLTSRGIEIITDAQIEGASYQYGDMNLQLSTGETVRASKVLVAAGRALNVEGVGLDSIGCVLEGRAIRVNRQMQTEIQTVYAVGDVVGKSLLAHVASKQGIVAAQNAMGVTSEIDYRVVPRTVWTIPQVAGVGLTELQAREAGYSVKVGRFPFSGLARAIASDQTCGFVKLVGDTTTGELLGAQMVGNGVTELIAEVTTAMQLETTVEELANTIHAHPTFAEAIMEAAWVFGGHPMHI